MLDDVVHQYAGWLRSAATDLDAVSAEQPRSFASAYGNGREVAVCDLTEAVERVEGRNRQALDEASFHSQDRGASSGSAFFARTWSAGAAKLSQASLDLTRAAEVTAALADARVRAPAIARAFEEQAGAEVDRLLASARAEVSRAIETLRSGADSLTSGRPLPAADLGELLTSPADPQQGPAVERRAAALSRSAPAPAPASTPAVHQAAPVAASATIRGRR
ncbi:hypothetical protein ACIGZJ_33435 [Kitasatospora sp. NPDC052868]|uniref:hypothetical protein n=1 Tax=Kitasatospora sp. NPDC052868 TaxID=3364060 RepID=UPI0037C5A958